MLLLVLFCQTTLLCGRFFRLGKMSVLADGGSLDLFSAMKEIIDRPHRYLVFIPRSHSLR